jgi:hypothetical protein
MTNEPRCHEVEHRRKLRMTLVDCLTRRSLGEGGWFVLFAFGKLKSRAFHALFVFPFQGQGKTYRKA